jgi:hypothetical protein
MLGNKFLQIVWSAVDNFQALFQGSLQRKGAIHGLESSKELFELICIVSLACFSHPQQWYDGQSNVCTAWLGGKKQCLYSLSRRTTRASS